MIRTLKDDRARREAARKQDEEWRRADPTRAPAPTYLGDGVEIVDSALSPDAKWLLVVTQAKGGDAGHGRQDAQVRDRVGLRGIRGSPHPRRPQRAAAAQAVAGRCRQRQGQRTEVRRPARHRDDPLAALRKAAKQDALKGNRDVRIETDGDGSGPAIHWSDDGRQVAVLVRAIDNKDRWLTSGRPRRRETAAAPPPDRSGMDQLELQRVRLARATARCGSCPSRAATRTCTSATAARRAR